MSPSGLAIEDVAHPRHLRGKHGQVPSCVYRGLSWVANGGQQPLALPTCSADLFRMAGRALSRPLASPGATAKLAFKGASSARLQRWYCTAIQSRLHLERRVVDLR